MFSEYAAATMTDIKSAARAQITLINTYTLRSMSAHLGNKGAQPAASAIGLGAGLLGGGASGHPAEHSNHVLDIDAIESLADEDDFVAMVGIWTSGMSVRSIRIGSPSAALELFTRLETGHRSSAFSVARPTWLMGHGWKSFSALQPPPANRGLGRVHGRPCWFARAGGSVARWTRRAHKNRIGWLRNIDNGGPGGHHGGAILRTRDPGS